MLLILIRDEIKMKNIAEIPLDAVSPGDRFFKVGCGEITWVIERIFVPQADGIPHVAMSREDGLPDRNVVSMITLLDTNNFRPDRRNPAAQIYEAPRRRKGDWDPRRIWQRLAG